MICNLLGENAFSVLEDLFFIKINGSSQNQNFKKWSILDGRITHWNPILIHPKNFIIHITKLCLSPFCIREINALLSNYSIIKGDRVGYMWHYYAKFVLSAIADDCNGDNRLLMLQYNCVREGEHILIMSFGNMPCELEKSCLWSLPRCGVNHMITCSMISPFSRQM